MSRTHRQAVLLYTKKLGELNYEVPAIKDVCAQDLVAEAYKELLQRKELAPEHQRVSAIAQLWGCSTLRCSSFRRSAALHAFDLASDHQPEGLAI